MKYAPVHRKQSYTSSRKEVHSVVHMTTNRSNILKEKARRLHTRQRRDLQIAARPEEGDERDIHKGGVETVARLGTRSKTRSR
jgi:hypothetical protein